MAVGTLALSADEGVDRANSLDVGARHLLPLMAVAALSHAFFWLWIALDNPLIDMHPFRQCQTAITAFYFLKDGFKLLYETPILGSGWSIPLEFPLYQWLVATLARLGPSIEASGRILSFAFLLATIYPVSLLSRAIDAPRLTMPLFCLLLCASPIYVYWGRSVMIETCALFFASMWLAFLVRGTRTLSVVGLAVALVAGSLAALVKSTTFVCFGIVGGIYVIGCVARSYVGQTIRERLPAISAIVIVGCVVPLCVGQAWVAFTDDVKAQDPLGWFLTSSQLQTWVLGTWSQRTSVELVSALLRALEDTFGQGWYLALVLCGVCLRGRLSAIVLLAAIGFVAPFLVFTNLHIVHNYYQCATAIFLLFATAASLAFLYEAGWRKTVALSVVVILGLQAQRFYREFVPWITGGTEARVWDVYRIALDARAYVPSDRSIIVLGDDWSAIAEYYSQRRGVTMPLIAFGDLARSFLAEPDRYLGGVPLGGVIYCSYNPAYANNDDVRSFVANRSTISVKGSCSLMSPDRSAGT